MAIRPHNAPQWGGLTLTMIKMLPFSSLTRGSPSHNLDLTLIDKMDDDLLEGSMIDCQENPCSNERTRKSVLKHGLHVVV